ncbi:MAG: hypothetical protein SGI73_06650 [Chloroflexota bacterium]|nr:hypothetical protein [Chloroflexota bacterium]
MRRNGSAARQVDVKQVIWMVSARPIGDDRQRGRDLQREIALANLDLMIGRADCLGIEVSIDRMRKICVRDALDWG